MSYNGIFRDTVCLHRKTVDFFIEVCFAEWDNISIITGSKARQRYIEIQTCRGRTILLPGYDFDRKFCKLLF